MINNKVSQIAIQSFIYKQIWLYCLTLILVIYIGINTNANCQPIPKLVAQKTVLVLFPGYTDMPYTQMIAQTIQTEFSKITDLKFDMYYEYQDINRFTDSVYQQQLATLIITKYSNKNIDLVIVINEVMLDFWLKYQSLISPDTPVVFIDIQPQQLEKRQLTANITGVSMVDDFKQSLNWIIKVCPMVNEIVIVHGVGERDKEFIFSMEDMKTNINSHIKTEDWSNLSLKEIKQQAAKLPSSTVIFYMFMFEDAAGVKFRPVDALQEITDVSSVPVISMYDFYIGYGTIGGYTFSMEQVTRIATQMGQRILHGESVSTIPIVTGFCNQSIFDHLVLQRFDIPISTLPSGSIIKNRQYTLWERYRVPFIIIISIFIVLISLIAFFVNLSRKLYKTRIELSNLNANLEIQVKDRTVELSTTNNCLTNEIAERQLAEENLVKSNLQLKELNSTKDKLFSIIAHDLKNPFSGILGLSEILASDHNKTKTILYAQMINDAAKSAYKLLENLLEWSRLQTGGIHFKPVFIQLGYLSNEVIKVVEAAAKIKNITIENSINNNIEIKADYNMLNTILRNLLHNAIKFTEKHGNITLNSIVQENKVIISVIDTGVGIEPENIAKLFKISEKIQSFGTENEQGTGLGLILCKEFVEKHGGSIWVESKLEKGSNFKFTMPLFIDNKN